MKETIKNKEMYKRQIGLNRVKNIRRPIKFAHAVGRNLNRLKQEIAIYEESERSTPEHQKYIDASLALKQEHCVKDEHGEIVPISFVDEFGKPAQKYDMSQSDNYKQLDKELKEKYKEAINEQKEITDLFVKSLEDETEIEVYDIPVEHFETAELSGEELCDILWMESK